MSGERSVTTNPLAVRTAAALLVGLLATLQAIPDVSAQSVRPSVSFSGFGTFGYAVLDEPDSEYRTGRAEDGADDDGSIEVDTRLGLQLDAELTRRLSATLQAIAREGADGEPAVALEWGFLRFLPTDSTSVRVGRMSLPVFALSDFREVGYANVLLRPPEDVYAQIPLTRFDGIDLTFDLDYGATLFRAQLFGGVSEDRIYDELEPDARESVGIALSARRGPLQLRLSHVSSSFDIDSENGAVARVDAGIRQVSQVVPALAPALDAIADDFSGERVPLRFYAIGASFDPGAWFSDIEFASRRIDSWVSNIDSLSVVLGARLGAFSPYLFASDLREIDGDRRIELPDGNPDIDALETGINLLYEPRDQRTAGLGLRWDPVARVALKAQVERVSREVIGTSLRRRADGNRDDGDDVTLFSAVVDVVF